MRKMTLLAAAAFLTLAAVSGARPLTSATPAVHPPQDICLVVICDAEGVCLLQEIFC